MGAGTQPGDTAAARRRDKQTQAARLRRRRAPGLRTPMLPRERRDPGQGRAGGAEQRTNSVSLVFETWSGQTQLLCCVGCGSFSGSQQEGSTSTAGRVGHLRHQQRAWVPPPTLTAEGDASQAASSERKNMEEHPSGGSGPSHACRRCGHRVVGPPPPQFGATARRRPRPAAVVSLRVVAPARLSCAANTPPRRGACGHSHRSRPRPRPPRPGHRQCRRTRGCRRGAARSRQLGSHW